MGLLALLVALLHARRITRELDAARAHLVQAQAAAAASAPSKTQPDADFTARLPLQLPSAAELAALLQRHCKAAGAQLLEFSSAEHAPSEVALGRREVEVELAGSYAAVKRALAEVLAARGDSGSLRALRIRAEPETSAVRARATLVFWSAASQGVDGSNALVGDKSATVRGR